MNTPQLLISPLGTQAIEQEINGIQFTPNPPLPSSTWQSSRQLYLWVCYSLFPFLQSFNPQPDDPFISIDKEWERIVTDKVDEEGDKLALVYKHVGMAIRFKWLAWKHGPSTMIRRQWRLSTVAAYILPH